MNTLYQKITAGLVLALSLSLTSCEKDSLLTPNPAGSARSEAVNDPVLPSPPVSQLKHTLIRYGNATLAYDDNGRLLNVTSIPVRAGQSGQNIRIDYTYSAGKIRAVSSAGLIIVRDETFLIDASGRCYESVEKGKYSDTHWIFEYNAKGQLEISYDKNSCARTTNYAYNADGDLILATISDSPSTYKSIIFVYTEPANTTLVPDRSPINLYVPRMHKHDTYLRIFGTPSKHLVKQVSYESSGNVNFPAPSDRFYTYTLDTDGYVKERIMSSTLGGSSIENTVYDYLVANKSM